MPSAPPNADVEAWLKVIMAPLEAQIRQHREQLRHRQASIQRIHDATESLEQKIAAFEQPSATSKVKAVRTADRAVRDAVGSALARRPALDGRVNLTE
jgi:Spy/CpxP family protein refolding chaperone